MKRRTTHLCTARCVWKALILEILLSGCEIYSQLWIRAFIKVLQQWEIHHSWTILLPATTTGFRKESRISFASDFASSIVSFAIKEKMTKNPSANAAVTSRKDLNSCWPAVSKISRSIRFPSTTTYKVKSQSLAAAKNLFLVAFLYKS